MPPNAMRWRPSATQRTSSKEGCWRRTSAVRQRCRDCSGCGWRPRRSCRRPVEAARVRTSRLTRMIALTRPSHSVLAKLLPGANTSPVRVSSRDRCLPTSVTPAPPAAARRHTSIARPPSSDGRRCRSRSRRSFHNDEARQLQMLHETLGHDISHHSVGVSGTLPAGVEQREGEGAGYVVGVSFVHVGTLGEQTGNVNSRPCALTAGRQKGQGMEQPWPPCPRTTTHQERACTDTEEIRPASVAVVRISPTTKP